MTWLTGWNYRKSHVLGGSTAGAQTNYQMGIKVYYGSGTDGTESVNGINFGKVYCNSNCKTDFGDVRFALEDGTLLSYWMESKTDSSNAVFWVKVDSIPASPSTKTVYVYYGDAGVSTTSNGNDTFLLFDHFDGASIDTNKWGGDTASVTLSNGEMTFATTDNTYFSIVGKTKVAGGVRSICSGRRNTTGPYYWEHRWALFDGTGVGGAIGNGLWNWAIYEHPSPSNVQFGYTSSGTFNTWGIALDTNNHKMSVARYSGVGYYTFDNSSTTYSTSIPSTDLAPGFLTFTTQTVARMYVDYVASTKFVYPEPSHGSWGTEEPPNLAAEEPFAFVLDFDGTDYYGFSGSQTVYGGPNDAGGVDGSSFSAVAQACLNAMANGNGGILHQKAFVANLSSMITIPLTSKTIIWEGEGNSTSVVTTAVTASLTNMVNKEPAGTEDPEQHVTPYPHRIRIRHIGFNCNEHAANGVNMSEPDGRYECPKDIILTDVRVEGHSNIGIIMNYCDNSKLIDCMVENPVQNCRSVQWTCVTGKVTIERGYYHHYQHYQDMEVAGQSVTLYHVQLNGVRIIDETQVCALYDCEMPNSPLLSPTGSPSISAFVEVATGTTCGDLYVQNPVVTLTDNSVLVKGKFRASIRIINPEIYIASGATATIFPSYPTLTSVYYDTDNNGFGPDTEHCARAYLQGGGIFNFNAGFICPIPGSWSGNPLVLTQSFNPAVNIMEIGGFMGNTGLRFDGKNLGNSVQNQTPPGGSLTSQEIMLPIPYCDGNYIVKLMPECLSYGGANQVAWISNKQRDRFTINYTYAGGWALDWMAIHLP